MRLVVAAWLLVIVVAHPDEKLEKTKENCGRFIEFKTYLGNQTEFDDFTWLVLLEYETPRGLRDACGGVLITNRHILTAAHCVANVPSNWTLKSARLGEYDRSTPVDCFEEGDHDNTRTCLPKPESIPIEASLVHESFGLDNRDNDLAVLRLAQTMNVTPICLPDRPSTIQNFHVAGWGRLAGRTGSGPKLRSFATLFNNTLCKDGYATQNVFIAKDQFCAGGKSKEWACFGDSGGPLMGVEKRNNGQQRMTVYGILTTDSRFCDAEGWPAVYVNVSVHMDWIQRQIK